MTDSPFNFHLPRPQGIDLMRRRGDLIFAPTDQFFRRFFEVRVILLADFRRRRLSILRGIIRQASDDIIR